MTQGQADEDQCETQDSKKETKFNVQTAVICIISALCMLLRLAILHLWKCLRRMQRMVETYNNPMVQPMVTANLVERMLQAENNIGASQMNESIRDIDTIYRT